MKKSKKKPAKKVASKKATPMKKKSAPVAKMKTAKKATPVKTKKKSVPKAKTVKKAVSKKPTPKSKSKPVTKSKHILTKNIQPDNSNLNEATAKIEITPELVEALEFIAEREPSEEFYEANDSEDESEEE